MTKKERVQTVLRSETPDYVPAGFSLHFPADKNAGEAGVQAHLEFFEQTDTDLVKIMNENLVPAQGGPSVRPRTGDAFLPWERTPRLYSGSWILPKRF